MSSNTYKLFKKKFIVRKQDLEIELVQEHHLLSSPSLLTFIEDMYGFY